MTPGFLALTGAVTAIVLVLWHVWRARDTERQRAEHAERSASHVRALIEGSDDVVHDVNGLLSAAFVNLEVLSDGPESDDPDAMRDVSDAIMRAIEMLRALRGDVEGSFEGVSTRGLVQLQAALAKAQVRVDLRIDADLPHHGHPDAAARIVTNLFQNAIREARAAGGSIEVRMSDRSLRISNPVRDPSLLDDRIYERGVSGSGSTGVGLAVCRELATRVGWTLSHEVRDHRVTFVLSDRGRSRALPGGSRAPAP